MPMSWSGLGEAGKPLISVGICNSVAGGAEFGSPGIQLSDSGETVQGYVFISEHLPQYWEELDAFEGDEYQRIPVKVYLENGEMIESLVYALKD